MVSRLVAFSVLAVVSCVGFYALVVEPKLIVVTHVRVEQPGLQRTLEGRVAVQLSDLHMTEIGEREERVLKIVEGLDPDFVFLTGDLIGWREDPDGALVYLSRLKAKAGVWAVMGDYDYSRSRQSCVFCHERGSGKPTNRHAVRFLKDSWDELAFQEGRIWIGGIDAEDRDADLPNGRALGFPGGMPGIVLSHSPLQFDQLNENQEQLMLAGDTHGGEIPLPAWLWEMLGYEKNVRYSEGVFERGRTKMIVSRGLGTSHLPVRFLRPPEIVVLHF